MLIFTLWTLFWLLVGTIDTIWFYFLMDAKGGAPSWSKALGGNIPYWIGASLLTPVVVLLTQRFRFERGRRWRAVGVLFVGSILFALTHQLLYQALGRWQLGRPVFTVELLRSVEKRVASVLDKEMLIYLVIVGGVYTFDYYRRYKERERAAAALELERVRLTASLSQAQLEALRMQLHPHFLFNTLHAISTLIMRGDTEAANQMLQHLSHFLRMTLDGTDAQEVPLAVELEFLDAYLRIQRVRFGERLQVETEIEAGALQARVPQLILQPLVENSIRHGISPSPGGGIIRIRIHVVGGELQIEVEDDGAGLPREGDRVEGIGLSNIRARLAELYPGAHVFTLEAPVGGGTLASVTIPCCMESGGEATHERHEDAIDPDPDRRR